MGKATSKRRKKYDIIFSYEIAKNMKKCHLRSKEPPVELYRFH